MICHSTTTLREICSIQPGLAGRHRLLPPGDDRGAPVITVADVGGESLTGPASLRRFASRNPLTRYLVRAGDILFRARSLVNRTAWAACDTFRGVVDAGQYKDYILVMLFLKIHLGPVGRPRPRVPEALRRQRGPHPAVVANPPFSLKKWGAEGAGQETCRERAVIERYSHVAAPDEIAENDFNLNIPRYVDTFEPEGRWTSPRRSARSRGSRPSWPRCGAR